MLKKDLWCVTCGRRVFLTDLVRGRAKWCEEWFSNYWGEPDSREVFDHTYDCEKEPRRLTSADQHPVASHD